MAVANRARLVCLTAGSLVAEAVRVLEASVDRAGVRRHQVEAVAPHVDILLIAAQQQTVRKAARADEAIGLAQPAVANGSFSVVYESSRVSPEPETWRNRGSVGAYPRQTRVARPCFSSSSAGVSVGRSWMSTHENPQP